MITVPFCTHRLSCINIRFIIIIIILIIIIIITQLKAVSLTFTVAMFNHHDL